MLETKMMNSYVWLQTCDGSIQQVEQKIAMISLFIREEISQKGTGSSKSSPICLPQQVSLALLSSILDYCRFHQIQGHSDKERKLYDAKFVKIDPNILCALASAAKSLQLKPLNDLRYRALARIIEGRSPEEIRDMILWRDDLTEEEKLDLIINKTCDSKIRQLNRLNRNRRKERERVLENVRSKQEEVLVEDEQSIEEILSFINGSNDEETKGNKTCKHKKKNKRKKKDQHKNSSMKEEVVPVVEFDDEIDQALMAKIDKEVEKEVDLEVDKTLTTKIDREMEKEDDYAVEFDVEIDRDLMTDREVEEFARRLNCTREERIKEILRDCEYHRDIFA